MLQHLILRSYTLITTASNELMRDIHNTKQRMPLILSRHTESESLMELERFVEAMREIRREIEEIENGSADREDNVLKNAPHSQLAVTADEWTHPYKREKAAFPLPWVRHNKFWLTTSRVDDAYGDRNLVCTCEPVEAYR